MLHRLLKTAATYWSEVSRDEYGDPTVSSPVPILCTWQDTTELFIDEKGDQAHSRAIVWTTSTLNVGGFLFRGTSVSTTPKSLTGADIIRRVDTVDGIDRRETLTKAYL